MFSNISSSEVNELIVLFLILFKRLFLLFSDLLLMGHFPYRYKYFFVNQTQFSLILQVLILLFDYFH